MNIGAYFLLIAFVLIAPSRANDMVAGVASVIDGDTIEIHGTKIRLFGIDAPESGQTCARGGKSYRCGQEAALALSDMLGRRVVACARKDTDRYGRMVAICHIDTVDVNRWLILRGFAIAYRRYSTLYVVDEDKAKSAKAGIWAGEFVLPSDYRRGGSNRPWARMPAPEPAAAPAVVEKPAKALTDEEIAILLIARSKAGYSGSCPCPENVDRGGRRCGARSAYSRKGGAAPLCHRPDVTATMIVNFRRRTDHIGQ